ncbi:MAG: GHKL domain-containing protein [Lachnospiraceae bacterium]|nr:GHKL domain-containing protein [Lachnospiraceae bacterium]
MKQLLDYADILITAPCYLGYLCMADKFCKKYLRTSKKNELLFVVLSFCGCLFLNIANRRYPTPHIFYAMLYNILFIGLVLLLFQAGWGKKILAASMLMTVRILVGNIATPLLVCLVLFCKHIVKKIPEPFLSKWESGAIDYVSWCLVALAIYGISKHLIAVFHGKPGKWYVMLAIPLLVLITVFDVASLGASNGIMVRSGGNMGLYYDQLFSFAGFLVLDLLSMAATGFYVFGMNRIYLEQEKSGQYRSQIAVYKMLAEQHRQSERLRHDMKNHIIALSALSRNKEWEKIDDYLKNMEGIALDTVGDMTGSKAVDALLYQKRKRAKEENIIWECDVQMPKGYCINEFDLCVLFGNILDNAVEACERMQCSECRFINIQAKTVKKCFLIEVKNSIDMTEKYSEGFWSKKGQQEYGTGLLNVSDVVHRYNGVVNIEAENGTFTISILMPFPDDAHDIKIAV